MDVYKIVWIWVSLLGRPNSDIRKVLIKNYGDLQTAWNLAEKNGEFKELSMNNILFDRVRDTALRKRTYEIYNECMKKNIRIVTAEEEDYPENLQHIPNKPAVLYYKGALPHEAGIDESYLLSVVGSRRCTAYGRMNAYQFAKSLAEVGIGIVSGMARGIDSEAHKGALYVKGYTIAVLGSGVDVIYPKEHEKIYKQIIENGCVVSEYPPGTVPFKNHFPARNRIISGLSKGVLVVEAAQKSGAMITVNTAIEQDRCIYTIPGNINSETSSGCNELLKSGVCCVTSPMDIIKEFNIVYREEDVNMCGWINGLSGTEAAVASAVLQGYYTANEIAVYADRSVSSILSALTILEIKGIVTKGLDGTYKLKK